MPESVQLGSVRDVPTRPAVTVFWAARLLPSRLVVKDSPPDSGWALEATPRTFPTETGARLRPCFLRKQTGGAD